MNDIHALGEVAEGPEALGHELTIDGVEVEGGLALEKETGDGRDGGSLGGSKEIYRGRNHIVVGGGIAIVHDLSTQRERRGRHHRRGTGEGDGGATKGGKGFADLLGTARMAYR